MLKKPQFYLFLLSGWLVLTNAGHTFMGIPELLKQAVDSTTTFYPGFAAMRALPKGGFFEYSTFEIFFLGMLALALLLLFTALVSLWVALKGNIETVSQFSVLNLVFWGFALGACIVFYPVDNMVIIALGAFLFSALAFWRARKEA